MTLDQINQAITRSEVVSALLLIVIALVILIERQKRVKR
jgi:hypothetical protein